MQRTFANRRRSVAHRAVRRDRAGAVAVEFALVATVIFLFFFAAIEMTNLNMIRHTAANAAYEGARQAIFAGATADDARAEVNRLLRAARVANDAQVDIREWPDRVRVTVAVPVNRNSWGLLRFASTLSVRQSCTLQREITKASN